jgi:hypothetical protein
MAEQPYANQLLLDRSEVRKLLGITSRMGWKRFMDSPQGKLLPAPVSLGGTVKWHRDEVLAFVRLLARTEAPKA